MKKLLLLKLIMLVAIVGFSQQSQDYKTQKFVQLIPTDDISTNQLIKKPNTTTSSFGEKAFYEEEINGLTWYDLQTNSAVMRRLNIDDNGNIATVWTGSLEQNRTWADRGSMYRYFDGSSWSARNDGQRIETVRCGWPNILFPASGGEVVISHQSIPIGSTTDTKLIFNSRPSKGTGAWTQKVISNTDLTWPRATTGGADGNSIHLIAVSASADQGKFDGLRRALIYYRSEDGGSTFNIQDSLLPFFNSTHVGPVAGDSYAITAKGDTIVIALFDTWNDVYYVISEDNGDTWSKVMVNNHPMPKVDAATDTFSGSVNAPDGSGTVLIGDDGTIHMMWGWIAVMNDAIEPPDEAAYTFFGFRDGLLYWNSNKSANVIDTIGRMIDVDLDGGPSVSGGIPNYGVGLSSMPSCGQASDDGTIYVSYSSVVEDLDDQGAPAVNYRHIYIVKSEDNGSSWSTPHDINPNDDFSENVYASINPNISGDYIHMLYQRDGDPGVALRDNATAPQPIGENEIVYAKIDRALRVGITEEKVLNNVSLYPNPSNGIVTIDFNRTNEGLSGVSIVSITGQKVFETSQFVRNANQNILRVDVSNYTPGVYFVSIYQNDGQVVTEKLIVE